MHPDTLRARRTACTALAVALALGATSCAAGNRLAVPAGYAADNASRWPPLPVDGYTTADGRRHALPGGYVIARGDSLTFARAAQPRSGLYARPAAGPVTLHADSVRSVDARLPGEHPAPAAGLVGGLLAVTVLAMLVFYGGVIPWYGLLMS